MTVEDIRTFAKNSGVGDNDGVIARAKARVENCIDPKKLPDPDGEFWVSNVPEPGDRDILGRIPVKLTDKSWLGISGLAELPAGIQPLYFTYRGAGSVDFRCFIVEKDLI